MHSFTKLFIVLCITTCSLVYLNIAVQVFLLAVCFMLLFSQKRDIIHRRKLKQNLERLISVILSIFILQTMFLHTGRVIFQLGWFKINIGGIDTAAIVSIRLIILVVLAAWLMGLNLKDYLDAFHIISMPESLAVMTAMTIRFIPLLAEQISGEREQIVLRGINLKKLGINQRLKLYRNLIMPVLGRTMQDVRFQAIALDLRGFRNGKKHSRYMSGRLKAVDVAVMVICVVLTLVPAFLSGS